MPKSRDARKERLNCRFNRIETPTGNRYLRKYGENRGGHQQTYNGFIKCKLAHAQGRSIIVPDLLFFGKDGGFWFEPLAFGPPFLPKIYEAVECRLSVNVSCGHELMVEFNSDMFVKRYEDGSELYRCRFQGPTKLQVCITGRSQLRKGRAPLITLYHHTKKETREKILKSSEFWLSPWNIQGTEKQLKNVGYVYFTPLDRISCDEDLNCIAMSCDETIYLMVDTFSPSEPPTPEVVSNHPNDVLPLKVYRGSTADRTATLEFDIDSSCLAPQHLLFHTGAMPYWYEVCNPFTQRIGVIPGKTLRFEGSTIESGSYPAKRFDYIVVGDASTLEGLAVPYDEETTDSLLKIERVSSGSTILQFWHENGNTDQFSTKDPELQIFR